MPAFPFILVSGIVGAIGGITLTDGVRQEDKSKQVTGAAAAVASSALFAFGVGVAIGNLLRS